MRIRINNPTKFPEKLGKLLSKKYADNNKYPFFLSDYKTAYNYCLMSRTVKIDTISLMKENVMVGHIGLIRHDSMGSEEAFFGFLDVDGRKEVFDLLWSSLRDHAGGLGVKKLRGPINGSIWHQYRCIGEMGNEPYFKTELFSDIDYCTWLSSCRPEQEITYYSAYRKKFDAIIDLTESSYREILQSSISIEKNKSISFSVMDQLKKIADKVFENSWSFTPLSRESFRQLYDDDKQINNEMTLYIVRDDDKLIGFLMVMQESDEVLIYKTICLLPDYQGQGIGNAIAHQAHRDALDNNTEKIIYALIRKGNKIKNFPTDNVVTFRNYKAYEFAI